ncbi:hypothetical protein KCP78_21170 [Salmonella enterica subsp. enterica]|nr:hypothetical protein KCP78_21170 [Salmonella enterica subsp. enterica]
MEHLHAETPYSANRRGITEEWTQPRWEGITRPTQRGGGEKYAAPFNPECTLAQLGAAKMWRLLHGGEAKKAISTAGAHDRRSGVYPAGES